MMKIFTIIISNVLCQIIKKLYGKNDSDELIFSMAGFMRIAIDNANDAKVYHFCELFMSSKLRWKLR